MAGGGDGQDGLPRVLSLAKMIPQRYGKHGKAIAIVLIAVFCMAPLRILLSLWRFVSTTFGMALGMGIGLGLAMHVFEHLEKMKGNFDDEKRQKTTTGQRISASHHHSSAAGTPVARQPSAITLEDSSSYVALMTLAGYPIEDKVLRGQVLRENSPFWETFYKFTDVTINEQRGPNILQQDWPSLPPQVAIELGRFVEHVMRDFISMWYYKVDKGCLYRDENEKRQEGILRDGTSQQAQQQPPQEEEKEEGNNAKDTSDKNTQVKRKMVFSTASHRRIPMMDKTYSLMSAVFGNLATRTEHVNIFSLALLKWTSVLAQTFKVYRTLRKNAQEKNKTESPTEIQVTREFLLSGKLHRAVTFGLDVPSLLFADASGEECGTGTDQEPQDPLQVLEERLYGTGILEECELDYNRMLAHRLVRALLPKADSSSPVAVALVVEIFGTFILLPIMALWIPPFLNSLIILAMNKAPAQGKTKSPNEKTDSSSTKATTTGTTTATTTSRTGEKDASIQNDVNHVRVVAETMTTSNNEANTVDPPPTAGQTNVEAEQERISTTSSDPEESNPTNLIFDKAKESVHDPVGDLILNVVLAALEDLQKYVNFEDGRKDHRLSKEDSVDWDNPDCQKAVLRLVMVIEAVLLHGRCMTRETVDAINRNESFEQIDDEISEASTEISQLNEALPQLLMEMTSDMDAFEAKIELLGKSCPQFIDENSEMDFEPETSEISTLRTLLSTWLHTGHLSRAISLIVRGFDCLFSPFYSNDAFLALPENASALSDLMQALNGVDIMVDTMVVLSSSRLDLEIASSKLSGESKSSSLNVASTTGDGRGNRAARKWSVVKSATGRMGLDENWSIDPLSHFGTMSTPRYLDFKKNSGFASSLREERERRIRSWETRKSSTIQTIHRRKASAVDVELHNEVHHLARIFFNGTNLMTIRDAARKNTGNENDGEKTEEEKVSLLTVETISNRRRIEVPDDDSSFLLKAQVG